MMIHEAVPSGYLMGDGGFSGSRFSHFGSTLSLTMFSQCWLAGKTHRVEAYYR